MDIEKSKDSSPTELQGGKALANVVSYPGITAGDQRLKEMGYEPELRRNLGVMTILGLSFSIIAAPFGLTTSASFALLNGGSPTMFWSWLFLSLITLAMAASLGELCSAYPSSGGVITWTSFVSPRKYARIMSFCTGWVSIVANVSLSLSIAFGEGQLILAAISIFRDQEWAPTAWQTILAFWAVMAISLVFNLWGVKFNYLEVLNTASVYWTSAATLVILIVLLVMAGDNGGRRSGYDALILWQNSSGWVDGWAFFVGCLTPAYVLTGYGTIAFLCEEVRNPEVAVPRAMVLSVLSASLTGLLYILPIVFTLPVSLDDLLSQPSGPLPALFRTVTGSNGGGFGLLFLILGVGMFASIGALTVALRCTWAFSRDGGLPFSSTWAKVNPTLALPVNATILTTIMISLLGLIYLGSTAAFSAFTGVATICLGISYCIPIAISLFTSRQQVSKAPWCLGPILGPLANIVTIVWIAFSVVLFCFPTTKTTEPASINYASVVFVGFFSFAALYYVIYGRKTYRGPIEVAEEVQQEGGVTRSSSSQAEAI